MTRFWLRWAVWVLLVAAVVALTLALLGWLVPDRPLDPDPDWQGMEARA